MRTLLLLAVAVVAVSLSGPLMAYAVVPPLAIAFWRNAFATVALAPTALSTHRSGLAALRGRRLGLVLVSGLALAVHFATWVTSLTLTSVASATAIVCLQLVWIVAWQLLRGQRYARTVVLGLVLALAGVLVVSGVDFSLSARALAGDGLALVGGVAAAAYTVLGSRARQSTSTTTYTFVCYGSCALVLVVACVVLGQDLGGYPLGQWGLLLLVTATAQLLGHSVFNHLLATTGPLVVSLALLLEVPGAATIAAFLLGQRPPPAALLGLAVMLLGLALVVLGNRGQPAVEGEPALEAPVD
ncbi:MAG: rane protein [Marmoricola sp.]|nr:rane protein [Marmoricola sp.]